MFAHYITLRATEGENIAVMIENVDYGIGEHTGFYMIQLSCIPPKRQDGMYLAISNARTRGRSLSRFSNLSGLGLLINRRHEEMIEILVLRVTGSNPLPAVSKAAALSCDSKRKG
ncbi:hypothetical protein Plhal304r1_c057g0143231 [Plasmopara halstedii]